MRGGSLQGCHPCSRIIATNPRCRSCPCPRPLRRLFQPKYGSTPFGSRLHILRTLLRGKGTGLSPWPPAPCERAWESQLHPNVAVLSVKCISYHTCTQHTIILLLHCIPPPPPPPLLSQYPCADSTYSLYCCGATMRKMYHHAAIGRDASAASQGLTLFHFPD